eukprot:CAMPEP_0172779438 /NCGR_PEP_ID=MMETSP1074-20121228/202423_1 /TAXON_ID=2916 /ORGANISM="Ceratium fusus, Strain PA161109" /LENGTH=188 /DNA_ID=CAMNT_0013616401 /DNA_START=156 /DNA_END=719 /DNA_ORIENTATION=+
MAASQQVLVVIGTSEHASKPRIVEEILRIVNTAFGHQRLTQPEVMQRLAMGNAGSEANRVLHMAFCGEVLVGCMSSTLQPPWTPRDCGHWQRLAMGDAGSEANRVLHMAFCGEVLVGCMSSTLQPPWTPRDCGHWGMLAVDPSRQGQGFATALVQAGEQRLAEAGCKQVQIEYHFTVGDPSTERLKSW